MHLNTNVHDEQKFLPIDVSYVMYISNISVLSPSFSLHNILRRHVL